MTSNLLSIGQVLKIPTTNIEIDYQEYVVEKGDSLYSIAQKFNVTVDDIIEKNNLQTTILSVGQILKIPIQKEEPSTPSLGKECFGEGYVEPTYETYTVKRGDNLYDIARKYNTTVLDLMELNNLYYESDLRAGMDIIVPKNKETYFHNIITLKGCYPLIYSQQERSASFQKQPACSENHSSALPPF